MKKGVFIFTLLLLIGQGLYAQRKLQQLDEEEARKQEELKKYEKSRKGFNWDRVVKGGNIGGAIYTGGSYFILQPMAGYKITETTIAGAGFTYIYMGYSYGGVKYSTNVYGPTLFARQYIGGQLFGHAEFDPINYEKLDTRTLLSKRVWTNQFYVGGGLSSGNGAYMMLLYNIMYDKDSYWGSPWDLRIGFLF